MPDTASEAVGFYINSAYGLQFTGGTHEEYVDLIHETHPEEIIEVDCAALEDYDDFFDTIADDLTTDPANSFSDTAFVRDHFEYEDGSLALYNFDRADKETIRGLAMYLKGLAEQTEVRIAFTVEDTEAIFLGNSDLHGRIRTIDLTDY